MEPRDIGVVGQNLWKNIILEFWPLKANDLNPYSKKTCEILDINNQFRKSSLNEFFNQIEFQYSTVRFADKFKNHIK